MKRTEKINTGDISVGKPLHLDVFDRNGLLLLKKGFVIQSPRQLNALFQRGACFMFDDIEEGLVQKGPTKQTREPSPFELIEDVYFQLTVLCNQKSFKSNFSSKISELCGKIQRACQVNEDASLGTILLSKNFTYSIAHQIHCAIVSEILSKFLNHPSLKQQSLLSAALTMNIAMIELQNMLFNHKGRLSADLKRQVQSHPQTGVELLRAYGVTDEIWLTTILQHHECMDGSGYPQGLRGKDIDYNARILTLADVYCVKLFSRAYRLPLSPDVAARKIITGPNKQCFDQDLAEVFVKEIGIFHPGSYVRLINGEVAVVTHRGEKIHHPIVHSVLKADGVPFAMPVKRDCSEEKYAIINSIPPQDIHIEINKLLLWDIRLPDFSALNLWTEEDKKMEDLIQRAAEQLIKSKHAITLTGAGISTESGIKDFRGPDGIWTKNPDAERMAYEAYARFQANPKEYWKVRLAGASLLGDVVNALPNPGHFALAELEKMNILKCVVTQNIDNLHQKAGSKRVLDYHGNIALLRCFSCDTRFDPAEYDLERLAKEDRLPPLCRKCNGVLKDDIVHFNEAIPADVAQASHEEASKCDLMLICGTSAVVYPFAYLPRIARQRGVGKKTTIIEINADPTPLTAEGISDYLIQGKTGTILPKLVEEVKKRIP